MLTPETICNVTNRSAGTVVYRLPEKNLRRVFNPGETKRIPYNEILEVASRPGGRELLYNYLYFSEDEVVTEGLNVKPEPEYYLSEDKIDEWLKTCTLDEFKDALDFAPTGVVDLIKSHSISLPLNNMAKCKALKAITGFDVEAAINNEQAMKEDEEPSTGIKERRVKLDESAASASTRRATPKYKVVGRDDNKEV